MTVVILTPDGTDSTAGTPTVTGAGSAHAALSDSSDSSYVTFDSGDEVYLSFGDLLLPAGAVITLLSPVVRDRRAGPPYGQGKLELFATAQRGSTSVWFASWSSFSNHTVGAYTAASLTDISDSDVDDASIRLFAEGGSLPTVVSELSLQVTYVAKPVVDVTAPTGTVTNTNRPLIDWDRTIDADGGAPAGWEVKIFSAAQYGAGGFDPDTSTPTDSVLGTGASQWGPADPLPDDTYRAYVRTYQRVLGSDHWSDWDYTEFEIAANAPGVPTITAVAENDDGRIWITLDDTLGATTHAFEVQRSIDAGATWETIRTTDDGLITPTGGVGRAYDTEVGNGVTVRYRARALNIITEFTTASAWSSSTTPTAWQSSSWWLKSPSYPDLNVPVELDTMEPLEQDANQGVFQPLGRRLPIVVSDVRSGFRGTVRFIFDDDTERAEFDDLLDLLEPLLLQAPPTDNWQDRYIMFGGLQRAQGVAKSWIDWTVETLPWTEVDAPTGDVVEWPAFGS